MSKIILYYIIFFVLNFQNNSHTETQTSSVDLVLEIKAELGEGAFWDAPNDRLFWVDIEGKKVHIYDPEKKVNKSFEMPSRVGTIVPHNADEAVVALEDGIYILNLKSGAVRLLTELEKDLKSTRFNDGKCDPNGNLWVGSMDLNTTLPIGSLYKVSPNGEAHKMLDSITVSNGIVWTRDRNTMYYIDTPTGHIKAFDFNVETSEISNERIAVEIDASLGFADGMTIDENDHLWVGMWQGEAVACFDPIAGKLIKKIQVPAMNVTACTFGGDNLETLYITTARVGMTDEEKLKFPLAGSVFQVSPGVRGVKGFYFGK